MKKEFSPANAGDVTGWFILHGDYSLAVRAANAETPAGAAVVRLERKDQGADDSTIEQVIAITAVAGTAEALNGSERMRRVQHRLRCTALTTAGAIFVLRGSGLIDA